MANSFIHNNQRINVGDHVAVYQKIEEEGKTRVQIFEGLIIGVKNRDVGKSFTIRKIASGNIGVERIIPVFSPNIDKIEIKARGSVRRAKLNYLRGRTGKLALRVKEKKIIAPKKAKKPAPKPKPKQSPKISK